MALLVVCATALLASGLTFFSGFGLGTLLLPAFAAFFPLEASVGLTAVVHLLNNLVKLALLGARADRGVVLRFGVPAALASFAGARALAWLSGLEPWLRYEAFGRWLEVAPVKAVVAGLMLAFAVLEAVPAFSRLAFQRSWLPVGGLLSGFFGGLSGHQGALRSAFMMRCGLSKEAFLASGVAAACLVDLTRLSVYARRFTAAGLGENAGTLAAAAASAALGAWLGSRLLPKVTLRSVQLAAAAMLAAVALGLGSGML